MPDYTFPVVFDGARISSGIGSRVSPGGIGSTNHRGIDIAAPTGTPVVAPLDLEVIFAGQAGGYGNAIYGEDAYGNIHRFGHLSQIGVGVGDTISQGGVLGAVGSTGNSTGSHLHYEIRDAAGNFLRDATSKVVSTGKKIAESQLADLAKNGINAVLKSNPITAPFAIGMDIAGINPFGGGGGESCGLNPMCYLEKWLKESEFVQRGALFIIATIFIIGGIAFLALGYNPKTLAKEVLKG